VQQHAHHAGEQRRHYTTHPPFQVIAVLIHDQEVLAAAQEECMGGENAQQGRTK
jgi:pyrimidine deaminase RibD-like protein